MFGRKHDDGAPDAPFWKQRGWIFSAVFLATAVLIGTVSYLTDPGDEADARAAHSNQRSGPLPTEEAEKGKQDPDERPPGCRTDDDKGEDTERPKTAPKDVAWKKLNGTMVPTSPSAGPTRVTGPVWWCYAHTPLGAVTAAHSILTHMSGADWRTVAEQQLIPGEGRERFISDRTQMLQSEMENKDSGRYSGFSVPAYSRNSAEIRLLIKSPDGVWAVAKVSMRWSGGDWKVKPKSDGGLFTSSTSAVSSGEFVPWGAD